MNEQQAIARDLGNLSRTRRRVVPERTRWLIRYRRMAALGQRRRFRLFLQSACDPGFSAAESFERIVVIEVRHAAHWANAYVMLRDEEDE